MKAIVSIILILSVLLAGCDQSKPAPKPISAVSQTSPEQMEKNIRDAEAKEPCSERNLRNATEEQQNHCNPSRGMFDKVKPVQPPSKATKQLSPSTRKS